ncbi:TPA: hypothetical protein ACIPUI_002965 [Citrobacter freundii]
MKYKATLLLFLLGYGGCLPVWAQESTASVANQSNNPLHPAASMSFHDYYTPQLYDSDQYTNDVMLRATVPVAPGLIPVPQILRISVPVTTRPQFSGGYDTGIGDINLFDIFLLKSKGIKLGVGPLLTANSASQDELGTGKWQGGLSAVAVNDSSAGILGGLLQWQKSFAGDDERVNVESLTLQPFMFYNLPQGWYLRSSGIMNYNLENDDYYVPVGFGAGIAWKSNNKIINTFIEPQWTVAHEGDSLPQFTVFAGVNITFMQ